MSQRRPLCIVRLRLFFLLLALVILASCSAPSASVKAASGGNTSAKRWNVSQNSNILQIGYGSGTSFPQYGALDLDSSYFRLVYNTSSGWGTSLILFPVFWSKKSCPPPGLCQSAKVTATWQVTKSDLVLSLAGTIGNLKVSSTVDLAPPANNAIIAHITTNVRGQVQLDNRPGEAFKPVMLSSMHISATQWDSQAAFIGNQTYSLPQKGWVLQSPILTKDFGLKGGTSAWKTNAPTIEVTLKQTMQINGWVTESNDPNADNIGFWAATTNNKMLSSWSYDMIAEAGQNL